MILANVIFGPRRQNVADQQKEAAESYLASLLHGGQVCGDYFLSWRKGILNAYVRLAGREALAIRYHSKSGRRDLRKVTSICGRKPSWRMLDDNSRLKSPSWKGAEFLYLFTHALDVKSPVCRVDKEDPIPVFLLPLPFEIKAEICAWQGAYFHHDNIWLGSGALEIEAYRQLADPGNGLAQKGRKLCREIETATRVPTFYYLMRYWARPTGEGERPCPGCGKAWETDWNPTSEGRFRDFQFKCDPCRLISHEGTSTDGGRLARIGEYNSNRKLAPR